VGLASVQAVAAAKVLRCEPGKATVRLARTGKLLNTDALFGEAMERDADAFGVLRLEAVAKGMLVVSAKPHVTNQQKDQQQNQQQGEDEYEEDEEGDGKGGPINLPSRLAQAGRLQPDAEDDAWLLDNMVNVLKMHADGRMKGAELHHFLRMSSKQPERINMLRLSDIALTSGGRLELSRGLFCLGDERQSVVQEKRAEFVFGGGNQEQQEEPLAPSFFADYASVAAKTNEAAADPKAPMPQYTGVAALPAKKKTPNKKGAKRSPAKKAGKDVRALEAQFKGLDI
jgi:hypothetical protein